MLKHDALLQMEEKAVMINDTMSISSKSSSDMIMGEKNKAIEYL
jgi:hypothetical protein